MPLLLGMRPGHVTYPVDSSLSIQTFPQDFKSRTNDVKLEDLMEAVVAVATSSVQGNSNYDVSALGRSVFPDGSPGMIFGSILAFHSPLFPPIF